tara:strand:- start:333 stop:500 length:168 start_codon:yes stop_codon:yes gene_type:complete
MDKHIVEWVEHHLPSKMSDDLWYLCNEVLDELGRREGYRYQVGIGLSFTGGKDAI